MKEYKLKNPVSSISKIQRLLKTILDNSRSNRKEIVEVLNRYKNNYNAASEPDGVASKGIVDCLKLLLGVDGVILETIKLANSMKADIEKSTVLSVDDKNNFLAELEKTIQDEQD